MEQLDLTAFPPGSNARPLRHEDIPALTRARNAYSRRLIGVEPDTEDGWKARFNRPGIELNRDTAGVFAQDGAFLAAAVAANLSQPHNESHNSFIVDDDALGHTHPEKPHGGETALLEWAIRVQRTRLPEAPEGITVVAGVAALAQDIRTKAVAESLGFQPVRLFQRMTIEMAEAPQEPDFPAGVAITTLGETNDLDAVARAMDEAFADHFGYTRQPEDELLEEWRYWTQNDPHHDPNLWFLAVEDGEIAGMCINELEMDEDPAVSYVGVLGVRKRWRKRGLGTALLRHAFCEFYKRGKRKASLDVDSESLTGATRLYEKAGMKETRRFVWRELVLREGKDVRRLQADEEEATV